MIDHAGYCARIFLNYVIIVASKISFQPRGIYTYVLLRNKKRKRAFGRHFSLRTFSSTNTRCIGPSNMAANERISAQLILDPGFASR